MYVQNAVKDSIKLSLKCLYMVDLDFCIIWWTLSLIQSLIQQQSKYFSASS